ncbi:conserved hypothetical protein [Heliomicrobium modesticaldum Ice1]|uniref:Cobalamin-independent methionine synthase MetE C-terminal/archaeal domain-containing protein n=1 Tax=Heliobacterium modesticaldum (strain ATCC 51547 / Ice1) TaxID=498761 RepID=B0TA30_HELMI|nr:hypothetical protein [Heliomicrobium modesticaldum]ABZ83567.1 conserved hypothetical protein [Heliomicrobium modesticaldum Ice1]
MFPIVTAMGSLPVDSYAEAKALVAAGCPQAPHCPQLPAVCQEDLLLEQGLAPWERAGLIRRLPDGRPVVDRAADGFADALARFSRICGVGECGVDEPIEWYSNDESLFAQKSPNYRRFRQDLLERAWPGKVNWVKAQLAGPLTTARYVTDERGQSLLDDLQLRELVLASAALQASWMASDLRRLPWPVMIFVDEPGLSGVGRKSDDPAGCAPRGAAELDGAAGAGLGPIENRGDADCDGNVVDVDLARRFVQTMAQAVGQTGALAGLHCCADTDWSLVLDSGVHVISFDACRHFEGIVRHAEAVARFLSRGGLLAWGLVPTEPSELAVATTEGLLQKLAGQMAVMEDCGVSGDAMRRQLILTPACGYGLRTVAEAERAYHLLGQLASRLKNAVRL